MAVITWGSMIYDIRGRVGAANIYNTVSGPALRLRGNSQRRLSSAQTLLRLLHVASVANWKKLTASQVSAWQTYAATLTRVNPVNGTHYTPSAYVAYMEIAPVFMRLNPGQFPPVSPPSSPFTGDSISITITGSVPNIVFIASAPNSHDVTTEFLIHRFTGRNLKHNVKRLGVAGFFAYPIGTLVANVQVHYTARYDTGYRFVRTSTGQQSPPVQGPFIDMFL